MRELAEAMLRGDVGEAAELADRFLARTRSRVAVFADLLQPAQYEVGERWYRGRATSDDEHRAALVLQRLVGIVDPTPGRGSVPAGSRCLLAVMPGEQHTLGLSMLALALEDDGWSVELLDSSCHPSDLPDLVERTRPRLLALSAGYLPSTQGLTEVVRAVRAQSVPVLVGGTAFNRAGDLWRRVGASAHGADARIGAVLARRLVRT